MGDSKSEAWRSVGGGACEAAHRPRARLSSRCHSSPGSRSRCQVRRHRAYSGRGPPVGTAGRRSAAGSGRWVVGGRSEGGAPAEGDRAWERTSRAQTENRRPWIGVCAGRGEQTEDSKEVGAGPNKLARGHRTGAKLLLAAHHHRLPLRLRRQPRGDPLLLQPLHRLLRRPLLRGLAVPVQPPAAAGAVALRTARSKFNMR